MNTVLTQRVAKLLYAPILVVACAILVKGYADVGDGFAAGVVAALAVVLQWLAAPGDAGRRVAVSWWPVVAFCGLSGAILLAAALAARDTELLTHLPAPGGGVVKVGTAELITAVAFDVTVFALVLGAVLGILGAIATTKEEPE